MYWSNLSAAANAAAAYQTGQAGYAVSHTPAAAATYTTQRAAGTTYDAGYPTAAATHTSATGTYPSAVASTTYDYGYGRTTQTPAAAAVAVAYDSTKTYYAQPSSATAYSAADTHFQAKTAYTNTSAYTATARQASGVIGQKSTYAGGYTGATAAVVAATPNYNSTSYSTHSSGSNKGSSKSGGGGWSSYKKSGSSQGKSQRSKPPPKPQQLHYCDVCKISCAGPQTYREHLDGQKHKKKEASMKIVPTHSKHGTILRCELCDVTCTGNDAYAAHIRGAKHQKVVKLHQKLGKPIPSTDPVVVGKGTSGGKSGASGDKKDDSKDEIVDFKEKEVEPVGLEYIEEMKDSEVLSFNCKLCECKFNDPNAKEMHMKGRRHRLQYKKKVNPELVVEVKPSLRQRKLQEDKLRRQQLREEMWRRREEERLLEEEERWYWEEQRRCAEEYEYFEWCHRFPRGHPPNMPPPMMPPGGPRMNFMPHPVRRPDSSDDRHVLAKHAEIYPRDEELTAIQKIVSNTEKALKMVSDFLANLDNPKEVKIKTEPKDAADNKDAPSSSTDDKKENSEKKDDSPPRMLKGVMRVGILAKGLLLKGDTEVQLVVLCGDKPTRALLDRIADNLPRQLTEISPGEEYEIERVVEEAALIVRSGTPRISVAVTLTSPIMREQLLQQQGDSQVPVIKDPPDVLDKLKCLEALAALRHAKWFQARANSLQSCVMVIRIIRDLKQRIPVWNAPIPWAIELMCEKVVASAGQPLSPGDALRRIFEAVASGLLLPGSPGLMDPCEKDPVDATQGLTAQEREDITSSAQHALRLIAFRQIHKVLGMDPLPVPKFQRGGGSRYNRKRRRNNSSGEGVDSEGDLEGCEGKKDKKDKKDVDETKAMETEARECK